MASDPHLAPNLRRAAGCRELTTTWNQNMGIRTVMTLIVLYLGMLDALHAQTEKESNMNTARVRYMVNDIDSAVSFYTKYLGFHLGQNTTPNFAMLSRGNLELVLSTPFGPGVAANRCPTVARLSQ